MEGLAHPELSCGAELGRRCGDGGGENILSHCGQGVLSLQGHTTFHSSPPRSVGLAWCRLSFPTLPQSPSSSSWSRSLVTEELGPRPFCGPGAWGAWQGCVCNWCLSGGAPPGGGRGL